MCISIWNKKIKIKKNIDKTTNAIVLDVDFTHTNRILLIVAYLCDLGECCQTGSGWDDISTLCFVSAPKLMCRGEWDELFGTTGGATILNLIASADRTTCGRRLAACCYGANNKVEEMHPSSQDCSWHNPHIHLTLEITAMFHVVDKMSQRPLIVKNEIESPLLQMRWFQIKLHIYKFVCLSVFCDCFSSKKQTHF